MPAKKRQSEDNSWTSKTEAGLKRADARAKVRRDARLKASGIHLTPFPVLHSTAQFLLAQGPEVATLAAATEVLLLLGEHWPTQSRPNVSPTTAPVRGMCLGLVYGLGGQGMKVSKVSESFPSLTAFINRCVAATLPEPCFTWSSLQLNYNYAAKRHTDGNNLGPSFIAALGEHTGGGLWTEDHGVVDASGKWAKFNGTKLHETQPFEGTRLSVIAFTHNACDELTEATAVELKNIGASRRRCKDKGV